MSKFAYLMVLTYLLSLTYGRPTEGEVEAGGEAKVSPEDQLPKVLKHDNGTVGVSFMGFKASVGLGAFITGNLSDGWPHAEFETPFGQRAGSGLGPTYDKSGKQTGFGYRFLEDALQRVAPVALPSSDAGHGTIQHSGNEHDGAQYNADQLSSPGHHKEHKANHAHHTKGDHAFGDVSNIELETPTIKELKEFKSIGDRKLNDNEIGGSSIHIPEDQQKQTSPVD